MIWGQITPEKTMDFRFFFLYKHEQISSQPNCEGYIANAVGYARNDTIL